MSLLTPPRGTPQTGRNQQELPIISVPEAEVGRPRPWSLSPGCADGRPSYPCVFTSSSLYECPPPHFPLFIRTPVLWGQGPPS